VTIEELTAAVAIDYLNIYTPELARQVEQKLKVSKVALDEMVKTFRKGLEEESKEEREGLIVLEKDEEAVGKGEEEVIVIADVAEEEKDEVMVIEDVANEEMDDVMVIADVAEEEKDGVMVIEDVAKEEKDEVIVLGEVIKKGRGEEETLENVDEEDEVVVLEEVTMERTDDVEKLDKLVLEEESDGILKEMVKEGREEVMVIERAAKETREVVGEDGRETVMPNDDLTAALVMKYMKKVAPELLKELQEKQEVPEVAATLEEVVKVYKPRKKRTVKLKKLAEKEVGVKSSGVRRNFTPEEDAVIKKAMDDGDINLAHGRGCLVMVGRQLNRTTASLHNRVLWLKRTGGVKLENKRFTLTEDLIILEALVLPRMKKSKLSKIVLFNNDQDIKDVTDQLDRGRADIIIERWRTVLQPILLQHYSGTLNLVVEVMLANYLLQNFASISDVNWPEVAARREFAGHTVTSLKTILKNILSNASKKYSMDRADVTIKIVADFSEQVYGEGGSNRGVFKSKRQRQQEVISFFEGKVEELGLEDFL